MAEGRKRRKKSSGRLRSPQAVDDAKSALAGGPWSQLMQPLQQQPPP
eukprot:CAMPEP_0174288378 /NCGR_PEP_ID=MMETSP0809-20121228/20355_1 /TAXON_ID=73025 ORGANISM="Eutreptiella gymnastica-like, Strain CCMP1594" /NCGR_SAMPLE_ID=MMETSP0809 /ASSEMBLY_ACC=CAM_ASM_000658 /LENGTH=46 /DNA_ID= /DNA_START= /DNA_END= /DNA_ORIENTATION=